jgi:DNA-binding MarR family transcriptional regulator
MKKPLLRPVKTDSNVIKLAVEKKPKRRADDKWSHQVVKLGYTTIPSLLLRAQAKLKITPVQFNVLMQVIEHWWDADEDPWPSKDTIARRMRKSPRMVQRYLSELEKKGLVSRIKRFKGKKRQTSNAYSLAGLVRKLKEVEPEFTKERDQKRIRAKKVETAAAG